MQEHLNVMQQFGWTAEEYEDGEKVRLAHMYDDLYTRREKRYHCFYLKKKHSWIRLRDLELLS